jgi:putative membrane protein
MSEHQKEILNLQECLALERTTLANERTFLSYARTAIMVFITGVTVFKLFPDMIIIFVMGWVAVVVSTIIFFVGMGKYMKRFGSLSRLSAGCMNPHKAKKKE